MIKMRFDTENVSLAEDIKYLDLTQTYFSDNHEWIYNSPKFRRLFDTAKYPAVALNTFYEGMQTLNEKINRINPVYMDMESSPIHTYVFYKRLYIYLIDKGQSLLNYGNTDYIISTPTPPFNGHVFDIKKPLVSPSFSPLFVGLICSLKQEKDWRKFKGSVLEIANRFYTKEYKEFDDFYPSYQNNGKDLYTYWLDILFPDELFDLTLKLDQIIKQTYGTIRFDLRHNLYLLAEELPNIIFKSRIGQKSFYRHMANKLDEYLNPSPNYQINLFDEFTKAQITVRIYEDHFYITSKKPEN